MYERPFVDGMTVHDVEQITISKHEDTHCVVIALTGVDGEFSRFTIHVWSDHRGLPRVVVEDKLDEVISPNLSENDLG